MDNDLETIFYYYTGGKPDMESKQFSKLIKKFKLPDKKFFHINDIDIVFAKVKEKRLKTIPFNAFLNSLSEIARKKGKTKDEIIKEILDIYNNSKNQSIIKEYILDNKSFEIELVLLNHEIIENYYNKKIQIKCYPKDKDEDIILLEEYYKELSFEELYNKGKAFKQCDDIKQAFTLLKNVLSGIELSDGMKAKSRLENKNSYDKTIVLYIEIPLLNGYYETIEIEFLKKQRDINIQFEKLKKRFLELKGQ